MTKENEKIYNVYKHTLPKDVSGKDNDMVYIGITFRIPEKRWGKNGIKYKSNKYFWNSINKYGWDNFIHDIVASELLKEEAENLEKELIAKYNSANNKFGYNIELGGEHRGKHSEQTKAKISNAIKGIKRTDETKLKLSISHLNKQGENSSFYGKHHTEDTKKKIAKALGQKVICVETGEIYASKIEAERQTKVNDTCIQRCCDGIASYAGKLPDGTKLHWKYVDDNNINNN